MARVSTEVLTQLYWDQGLNLREIGSQLGCSHRTVGNWMSSLGIERRQAAEGRRSSFDARLEKEFSTWSPRMAEFLGYIWADGSVSLDKRALELKCSRKDKVILEVLKEEFGFHQSVCDRDEYNPETGKTYFKSTMVISGVRFVGRLVSYGIVPRKTYLDLSFPNVPEEFLSHFIRGYFVGDGCISLKRDGEGCGSVGYYGSEKFLRRLNYLLMSVVPIASGSFQERPGCWRVCWYSRSNIEALGRFMYGDDTLKLLPRKRYLFESLGCL